GRGALRGPAVRVRQPRSRRQGVLRRRSAPGAGAGDARVVQPFRRHGGPGVAGVPGAGAAGARVRRRVLDRGRSGRAGSHAVAVIFHLAVAADWEAAGDEYRMSTVGRTLDDEGFVHCSYAGQVEATAARFYAGSDDVLLLTID